MKSHQMRKKMNIKWEKLNIKWEKRLYLCACRREEIFWSFWKKKSFIRLAKVEGLMREKKNKVREKREWNKENVMNVNFEMK
jgi:hypothetical protein